MKTVRALALLLTLAAALAAAGAAAAAPPANDAFANAVELAGDAQDVAGTNREATKELGEPRHAGNAGGASIWYRWTAPAAGRVTVSTCGSDFDTLLAVYTGEQLALLDDVEANDDACGEQSRVSFATTAGTTYRIAVDGYGGATGGVFLSLAMPPPNDDFAAGAQVHGDAGSVTGTSAGATREEGEPNHAGAGWNSVWYEWTPGSSGWATFETCERSFDTVLAVYTGLDVRQLSFVAANDDACGLGSRVHFRAVAGTAYRLAVAGFDGDSGEFTLRWSRNPPPPTPLSPPIINGPPIDAETLTAHEGEWASDAPITFGYAWGRCDSDDECDYIPGATSSTFSIRSADIGFRLFVRVTATNSSGATPEFSALTAAVAPRAPSNTAAPTVTGEAAVGEILTGSPGTWVGTAPVSTAYRWQSCNANGVACADIRGETAQIMRITSAEVGFRIRVVVTATNARGSAAVPSQATAVVVGSQQRPPTGDTRRRCVVPRLRGKTLRAARVAITGARCSVGRIRRAFSSSVRAGRIVSQTPRAGSRLPARARVHVVVSRGRRG